MHRKPGDFSATDGVVESLGGTDNASSGSASLLTDQWTEVWIEIDLDSNLQTVYYEGAIIDGPFAWNVSGAEAVQLRHTPARAASWPLRLAKHVLRARPALSRMRRRARPGGRALP